MTSAVRRRVVRWIFAFGLGISTCGLYAADMDGDSGFDGAFLVLSSNTVHDHLVLSSFKVTPLTRAAFIEACAHGKRIWINGRSSPCLSAQALENGSAIQVEVPQEAIKSSSDTYFLVSAKPAANAA